MREVLRISPELNTALIGCIIAVLAWITATLKKRVEQIMAEMQPDHGSSARDAINRTEAKANEATSQNEIILSRLDNLTSNVGEITKDVGGIKEGIRILQRADNLITERAEEEHRKLWATINRKG